MIQYNNQNFQLLTCNPLKRYTVRAVIWTNQFALRQPRRARLGIQRRRIGKVYLQPYDLESCPVPYWLVGLNIPKKSVKRLEKVKNLCRRLHVPEDEPPKNDDVLSPPTAKAVSDEKLLKRNATPTLWQGSVTKCYAKRATVEQGVRASPLMKLACNWEQMPVHTRIW